MTLSGNVYNGEKEELINLAQHVPNSRGTLTSDLPMIKDMGLC